MTSVILLLALSTSASGQVAGGTDGQGAVSAAPAGDPRIEQLQRNDEVYQQVIRNLILRIEQLERALDIQPGVDRATPGAAGEALPDESQQQLEEQARANAELIHGAFEQRLGKEGGMLLGAGRIVYEPGFSYAYSSYEKIAIDGFTVFPVLVVGDIVSEKVKRDVITNSHALRFGLGGNSQLDLVIPLGYEKELFYREDESADKRRKEGLGDVTLGISHQLIRSSALWPDSVIALSWKTTTGEDPYRLLSGDELALGSGFDSYSLSFTSVANSDPLVLFGGVTVNYTDGDHKPVGFVEPGMSYGLNLGMVLAVNFDTSLSFSFQLLDTDKTRIDHQLIDGSNMTTGTFAVGLSTAAGGDQPVDVDLAIGLTSDSPDFQLTVSFPIDFEFD